MHWFQFTLRFLCHIVTTQENHWSMFTAICQGNKEHAVLVLPLCYTANPWTDSLIPCARVTQERSIGVFLAAKLQCSCKAIQAIYPPLSPQCCTVMTW